MAWPAGDNSEVRETDRQLKTCGHCGRDLRKRRRTRLERTFFAAAWECMYCSRTARDPYKLAVAIPLKQLSESIRVGGRRSLRLLFHVLNDVLRRIWSRRYLRIRPFRHFVPGGVVGLGGRVSRNQYLIDLGTGDEIALPTEQTKQDDEGPFVLLKPAGHALGDRVSATVKPIFSEITLAEFRPGCQIVVEQKAAIADDGGVVTTTITFDADGRISGWESFRVRQEAQQQFHSAVLAYLKSAHHVEGYATPNQILVRHPKTHREWYWQPLDATWQAIIEASLFTLFDQAPSISAERVQTSIPATSQDSSEIGRGIAAAMKLK